MRRLTIGAALAAALALAGCGSSGPPPISHADRVACRTVWRMQQVVTASQGLPVFAPDAAAETMAAASQGTTGQLRHDMHAAYVAFLPLGSNVPTTGQLRAVERDCTRLGITARNAERMAR